MRLLNTSSATTLLLLLNTAVIALGNDVDLCRCTAKFEHFYDRRSLLQQSPREVEEDRSLLFSNDAYDYDVYYVDDNGYYVIDGVRVLPDDDPACDGSEDDAATAAPHKRDGILARVFGQGRSLVEPEEVHNMEEEEDGQDIPQLRTLMGMMSSGGMMSSSDSGYDDYYNYGDDGYSKGKVRFFQYGAMFLNMA
jgi:hypothetical protein